MATLQIPDIKKQPLTELVNDNGTVTLGDAKAIVASNEQGFLFLPASAFGDKAKLWEWARVELDVCNIPEDRRTDEWLSVTWSNNIGGSYVLTSSGDFRDARDAFHLLRS